MIENIFGKAGVLGEPVKRHQPCAEEVWEPDEEEGEDTSGSESDDNYEKVKCKMNAGGPKDFWMFIVWNKLTLSLTKLTTGMVEKITKVFGVAFDGEAAEEHTCDVRRPRCCNLGIAAHDNGVAVMPSVGPSPNC